MGSSWYRSKRHDGDTRASKTSALKRQSSLLRQTLHPERGQSEDSQLEEPGEKGPIPRRWRTDWPLDRVRGFVGHSCSSCCNNRLC